VGGGLVASQLLPPSTKGLSKLTCLYLNFNNIKGLGGGLTVHAFTGPLPALPFAALPFAQYTAACDLSGNDFACPLPAGAA
jgi:hypothetical protein